MNKPREGAWARVIVEKPFGTDLATARQLNSIVQAAFPERDTYRIDHFLGKETAQNILVLRFANAIFEPLWNTRYIDHVQITAAETLGVEGPRRLLRKVRRAARHGAESFAPTALPGRRWSRRPISGADSIRDEKVKVVRSLRRLSAEDVATNVVRGQYAEGAISGKAGARLPRGREGEARLDDRDLRRASAPHR